MAVAKLRDRSIRVPQEVLDAFDLAEGDEFDVNIEDGGIVLRLRKETLDAERLEHIRAAVAEGLEDYHAGRVTPAFESMEEFEAYRKTEEYRKLAASEQR
jgi:antitoxin component of MazEF toxin-antitoxin module